MRIGVLLAGLLGAASALAVEVNVVGLFPGKAVLSINDGAPRTVSVGQKIAEGVKLLSVDGQTATLEIDGKRQTLGMGQHVSATNSGGASSVTLAADTRGQFFTQGSINGQSMNFIVDTGATYIALGASDARRLGISTAGAQQGYSQTANGRIGTYRVKLDTVRIGSVTLNNVDASVLESDMGGVALLGMSFLNRMEMQRNGDTMTLKKRF